MGGVTASFNIGCPSSDHECLTVLTNCQPMPEYFFYHNYANDFRLLLTLVQDSVSCRARPLLHERSNQAIAVICFGPLCHCIRMSTLHSRYCSGPDIMQHAFIIVTIQTSVQPRPGSKYYFRVIKNYEPMEVQIFQEV